MWHSLKKLTLLLLILLPVSTTTHAADDIHHIVFVWLMPDTPNHALEETLRATQKLASIAGVEDFKVAKALPSERATVDDSFSFGITMRFTSDADMQRYLADDIHKNYVRNYIKGKTAKVVIHDF